MKKHSGESLLLICTLIWGSTFALMKNAFTDVSSLMFLGLRFTIATLILLPFVYSQLKVANKKTILAGAILGIFYFSGFAAQTFGLTITTATKSGFITGIFVVIIPILQFVIEKRKPRWYNLLSIMFVLIGLLMLSSKGENLIEFLKQLGNDFNLGDLLTLICALLFAFQVVYVDVFTKKYEYMPMVFVQLLISGLGGFVLAYIFSAASLEEIRFTVNFNVISTVLYTAIFASVIATIIQLRYQKTVSPTKAGIIYSIEPIFAAAFAYFLLSENISNFGLVGCVLIFSGLIISEVFTNKNE